MLSRSLRGRGRTCRNATEEDTDLRRGETCHLRGLVVGVRVVGQSKTSRGQRGRGRRGDRHLERTASIRVSDVGARLVDGHSARVLAVSEMASSLREHSLRARGPPAADEDQNDEKEEDGDEHCQNRHFLPGEGPVEG